jgi:UDP-GlcNAc:undecaprenyl-phosphate GlcNAc-1-phosphate transferase
MPVFELALAFCISWLLTKLMIRWAPRLGLVDEPSQRKVHLRTIPLGGGVAIFAGVALVSLLPWSWSTAHLVLVGLGGGLALVGLLDDMRSLPWQIRLGIQGLAAVLAVTLMWMVGWQDEDQSLLQRPLLLPAAVAIIWIVGLTNAFNMLDNMDALSAGVASIVSALLVVAAMLQPNSVEAGLAGPALILLGSALGFLCFNRPPARIFMGDAGSTFLGFYLGTWILRSDPTASGFLRIWLLGVWLMAIPWYDLGTVVILRLSQGQSPFHADKQHLSHRLTWLGLSRARAAGIIHLLTLAGGAIGLLLYQWAGVDAGWLGGLVVVWWVVLLTAEVIAQWLRKRITVPPPDEQEGFYGQA